jgi:hypothetical protein
MGIPELPDEQPETEKEDFELVAFVKYTEMGLYIPMKFAKPRATAQSKMKHYFHGKSIRVPKAPEFNFSI